MDDLGTDISVMFADTGPLAQALAGFEPRDGQRQMAAAVSGAIERGGTLLAEAGTGTGKTLAYLIPAILSRQRVACLHRHQESSGADLLQGSADAARGAGRAVHRDPDEGPVELPVPPSLSDVRGLARPTGSSTSPNERYSSR